MSKDTPGQNPWRYRVYVVQTAADGTELHKEFVAGKRLLSEAQVAFQGQVRSMRNLGIPDANGVTWSVELRDEPYPEFP